MDITVTGRRDHDNECVPVGGDEHVGGESIRNDVVITNLNNLGRADGS